MITRHKYNKCIEEIENEDVKNIVKSFFDLHSDFNFKLKYDTIKEKNIVTDGYETNIIEFYHDDELIRVDKESILPDITDDMGIIYRATINQYYGTNSMMLPLRIEASTNHIRIEYIYNNMHYLYIEKRNTEKSDETGRHNAISHRLYELDNSTHKYNAVTMVFKSMRYDENNNNTSSFETYNNIKEQIVTNTETYNDFNSYNTLVKQHIHVEKEIEGCKEKIIADTDIDITHGVTIKDSLLTLHEEKRTIYVNDER